MSARRTSLIYGLYKVLGVLNLLFALVITIGGLFASFGFGASAALVVDLPLGIGLTGDTRLRRIAPLFTASGCIAIIVYIVVATHSRFGSGYSMLPFHKVWAALCVVEIALSFFRVRQLQQAYGATTWPQ